MAQHDGTAASGDPQGNDAFDTRPIAHSEPDSSIEPGARPETGPAVGRAVREIVETLLLAALIFFAVRLVVLNFRVDGESMIPNLHNEEMLLVNRNAYRSFDLGPLNGLIPGASAATSQRFYPFDPPERGDIVVFDPPTNSNKPYIKRVIGLPGEQITFQGGSVYVNGERLDEPYIDEETTCDRREQCDVTVPAGDIFVLGDNRGNSSDSRVFGSVPVERVIGKAWVTYWPPSDAGFVPHYTYPDIPKNANPPQPAPADAAAPANAAAPISQPAPFGLAGTSTDNPNDAGTAPTTKAKKHPHHLNGSRKTKKNAEAQPASGVIATPGS
ncbi:MAG: signal peptidase I [Thermomicrobiales bacterium]|nr:signal peptidase I [Thermomicrobiales bacterium]